jgi:cell division protein ZapE
MEKFYESLNIDKKKFLHYQEFMLQIHEREHKVNKLLKGKSQDTISVVGNQFCEDMQVFCIDEF